MKKITLPKWAVVNGLGNARMIHIGNGEFVSADAQLPLEIESCYPVEEKAPGEIEVGEAPEEVAGVISWALGSFPVAVARPEPQPETVADALNAEKAAEAEQPVEQAKEE